MMSKMKVIVGESQKISGFLIVSDKPLSEVAKIVDAEHRCVSDVDFFVQGGVQYTDEELDRCVQECESPKFAWVVRMTDLKFDTDLEDVVGW